MLSAAAQARLLSWGKAHPDIPLLITTYGESFYPVQQKIMLWAQIISRVIHCLTCKKLCMSETLQQVVTCVLLLHVVGRYEDLISNS